ncbi:hypothetical protein THSYN_30535 (plasmid) [Candidatus Thiodictyon syntrophicum]|uniref:Uncharacterized protein n=1 Tax=Candidatus Thiodictyon syntrophicum TaxID=1166950 RepID=A0A2K8UI81_9GAMM|nr:hypothetical protein THSYN_30535 [Candidatus Thiodictyon syntrophicum]
MSRGAAQDRFLARPLQYLQPGRGGGRAQGRGRGGGNPPARPGSRPTFVGRHIASAHKKGGSRRLVQSHRAHAQPPPKPPRA